MLIKMIENTYKYHQKVTIDIHSNSLERLKKIAYTYFSLRLLKLENDPDDLKNYVSVNTTSEEVEENK